MAYDVKITEKAEQDLDEIVRYICEVLRSPQAARHVLA